MRVPTLNSHLEGANVPQAESHRPEGETLKTLSVRQPWCWAILAGVKTIENRSWTTNHRGPLAVHASRSPVDLESATPHWWRTQGGLPGLPAYSDLPMGQMVGIVDVVGVVPLADVVGQPFAEGPVCWLLANPRAVVPFDWRGLPGLFNIPDELLKPIHETH